MHRGHRRGSAERRLAGQEFVEHRAERINVAGRANVALAAGGLLRRHVAGSAHDHSRLRHSTVVVHEFGQAKVGDPWLIGSVDEHVLRLQVAMQSATLVSEVDGLGDDLHVARRRPWRQRPVLHEGSEVATRHIIHREVMLPSVLADFVDGDDVGVLQVGGRFGLSQKSFDLVWTGQDACADHFQGQIPVQTRLPGLPDDAHAAPGDLFEKLVITKILEARSGLRRARGCRQGIRKNGGRRINVRLARKGRREKARRALTFWAIAWQGLATVRTEVCGGHGFLPFIVGVFVSTTTKSTRHERLQEKMNGNEITLSALIWQAKPAHRPAFLPSAA